MDAHVPIAVVCPLCGPKTLSFSGTVVSILCGRCLRLLATRPSVIR